MNNYIFFVIVFLFVSCNTKEHRNKITSEIINSKSFVKLESSPIEINHQDFDIIPYSEINKKIKDIKYIPLKSKEPIGIINQVIIHEDRIFILDAFRGEMVFIFNLSGDLIKMIHDKGAGPKEYAGLSDMSISKKDSLLILNDRLSLYTLSYSLDGNFIKKERGAPKLYFEMLDGKYINQLTYRQSFSDKVNYQIVVSEGDSVIRKGFEAKPIQLEAINSKSLIYNYKDELLFCPTLSDTVYQIIDDSTYSVRYIINQKKSIWTKNNDNLKTEEYTDLVKKSGYTYLGKPILDTQDYLYYTIGYGDNNFIRRHSFFYDKNKNTSFVIAGRENETDPIYSHIPKPLGIFKNYFIGVIDAYEVNALKEYIKQGDNVNLFYDKNLKNILLDQTQELECIIVLYEFS